MSSLLFIVRGLRRLQSLRAHRSLAVVGRAAFGRAVCGTLAWAALAGATAFGQTAIFDFGSVLTTSPDSNGNYWNNILTGTFGTVTSTANVSTGYTWDFSTGVTTNSGFVPAVSLPNLGNLNQPTATTDGVFLSSGTTTFRLQNVNPWQTYDFTLYGGRETGITRVTQYVINGSNSGTTTTTTSGSGVGTVSGTAVNYATSTVGINGITTSGTVLVNIIPVSGGFAYLNAMQMTGYVPYATGGTIDITEARTYPGATSITNNTTVNANAAGALGNTTPTDLTIAAGSTLNLGASQTVAALTGSAGSVVNVNANTLTVNGSGTTTFAGGLAGTGGLTKSGAGTLRLSASSAFTGAATVSGGVLALADVNALQNATLDTGVAGAQSVSLAVAGANTYTVAGLAGSDDLALGSNSLTVSGNARTAAYAGGLSGSAVLTKLGSGTQTLSGSNSHSGGTVLSGGRLNVNHASALGTGNFTIGNGVVFANTSGSPIVNQGNNALTIGGTATFAAGTLDLGTGPATLASTSRLIVESPLTIGGVVSGSSVLAKDGGGRLTLAGSNAMTSFVVVDFGELQLGNVNALANAQLYLYSTGPTRKATFGVSGANTYQIGEVIGTASGVLDLGVNSVAVGGNGSTGASFPGQFTGSGGFVKQGGGTYTLSGSNGYTGATTVSAGRLVVAATGAVNTSSGVSIAGGDFRYNSATPLTAPVTFTAGILSGTGTIGTPVAVAASGTLSPGNSPGQQTFSAGLAWNQAGGYSWEVNSLSGTAGINWDLIAVTSGTFDLSTLGSVAPQKFFLDLTTLAAGNVPGPLSVGYVPGQSYEFQIVDFAGATLQVPNGFSTAAGSDLTSLFTIGLANWQGTAPALGDVSVRVAASGSGLNVVVVPEPSVTVAAMAGGALLVGALRRRRRAPTG